MQAAENEPSLYAAAGLAKPDRSGNFQASLSRIIMDGTGIHFATKLPESGEDNDEHKLTTKVTSVQQSASRREFEIEDAGMCPGRRGESAGEGHWTMCTSELIAPES